MKRRITSTGLIIVGSLVLSGVLPRYGHADVVCVRAVSKIKKGKVSTTLSTVTRAGGCKKGEVEAQAGADGADGQLRIYGDGSLGAKTFSTSQTFDEAAAMYTDVVINSGVTLIVPSGTVIRCTGNFVNNGTIRVGNNGSTIVGTLAWGGYFFGLSGIDTNTRFPASAPAHPGISARAAMVGEMTSAGVGRSFGLRGLGISEHSARLLRYPGAMAGGGGGGGMTQQGGTGGGSLVVLCSGSITNNGTIRADALNAGTGAAGGGGGVLILASPTSVTSASGSVLSARGGNGGVSNDQTGASGGGGGGIIHLMSPSISTTGASISVAGGAAGVASGTLVSLSPSQAGHGGGASGGDGGDGGGVNMFNNAFSASDGSDGHALTTLADPTSLF